MVDKIKTHKDMDVWKESIELARLVYLITSKFPKEELYGITQQIRRSAVSISSNIAEGAARNSKKEFIQFLYISLGSLAELDTTIIIRKAGIPSKHWMRNKHRTDKKDACWSYKILEKLKVYLIYRSRVTRYGSRQ